MKFEEQNIKGLFHIKTEPFKDERGSFERVFCGQEFVHAGIKEDIKQANVSKNPFNLTLRGLHYQLPPFGEGKLLRCETGSIFDVAIDMRH